MTEWVSQSDAVKLLAALGDKISQPALSQFLKGHPEVERQDQGPGRGMLINFDALKQARATRLSRGPASAPVGELQLVPVAQERSAASGETDAAKDFSVELGRRKAKADTETAEFNSRRARILAEEAEGRLIDKDLAVQAFMAAGVALMRAMEEGRRKVVDDIRAARDSRTADMALADYQTAMRAAFANSLADLAIAADPMAQAAQ